LKQVVLTLAIGGRLTDTASGDGEAAAELARHGIASKDYPRKGWAKAALGDLGSVLGGATPSKARPDFWVGPIPWVSPKDMKRPDIADAEDHVSAAALDSSALKLIPANSILMVVRGMILAHSFPVARTLVPVTMNQDMKALVPPAALVPYLLLALQALKPQIVATVDRSSHGTCKLVSEKLWSVEIGVPPLAEQHRIVAKVTELLALCDQLKARIADARSKHAQLAEALVAQAVAA
jgi:type I restriction enzyme S subunit